ncbi:MAG: hypothetical protein LBD58_02735 [Treponema sp.]|jgi:hypothetical protein|nr:hypothetical protein [Treponema sp.]
MFQLCLISTAFRLISPPGDGWGVGALIDGVGFDFSMEGCDYRKQDAEADYSVLSLDFGLGGNANLKLDVTDAFYVVLGVNVTCSVAD